MNGKNSIIKIVSSVRLFLLDLIFPIECIECGLEGEWLCQNCRKLLRFNKDKNCPACGQAVWQGEYCPSCNRDYYLDGIISPFDFDDKLIKRLIYHFKYNFVRDIGRILSEMLIAYCRGENIFKENFQNSLLVPVPLHWRRERWRGYNQAFELCTAMAKEFDLESVKVLVRKKNITPQAKLKKEQRWLNVKEVFALDQSLKKKIDGRLVVLVDDVVTTGATMGECARVLKMNGAREVWGMAIAKG